MSTTESGVDFNDYRHVIGMMFFGGAGSNIARDLMDSIKPKDSPDLLLFVTNTDGKLLQEHFGDANISPLREWLSANALTVHQLGGREVTQGRGAGGESEEGRKAAETEVSKKAMKEFMERVDKVILIGGLGGGTGTGAIPVAAKLAKELNKETLAWVVMPEAEEGRADKAAPALELIRELVPTIKIQNDDIDEWIVDQIPDEQKRRALTFKQAWQIVNQRALVPLIVTLQDTLQNPGDVINSDAADDAAMMKMGHYVLLGKADIDDAEKVAEKNAEEIIKKLLACPFQDNRIIKRGVVASIAALGPWPKMLMKEIARGLRKEILGENPTRNIGVNIRNRSKMDNGKMWIAVTIVAKDLNDPTQPALPIPAPAQIAVVEVAKPLRRIPVPVSHRIPPAPPIVIQEVGPLVEAVASKASTGSNGDTPDIEIPNFIRK